MRQSPTPSVPNINEQKVVKAVTLGKNIQTFSQQNVDTPSNFKTVSENKEKMSEPSNKREKSVNLAELPPNTYKKVALSKDVTRPKKQ